MFRTPNLRNIAKKASFPNAFVNTFTSCYDEETYFVTTEPSWTLSLMK